MVRIGNRTASPKMIASPVRSTGNILVRPSRLSESALVTCERSVELLNRIAKKVPHCDRIVGLISAGRWLTIIAPIPYLRPSLTIRCVAIEAALLPSSPR
ncbi:hypothetical protein G6F60_014822 [Rhizopus arrhizus]|nr:hypothetical protein G6F60_014822 [Rhizopus arrhizus]